MKNVNHPTILDIGPFVLVCRIFLSLAIFINMNSMGTAITALMTAVIIKAWIILIFKNVIHNPITVEIIMTR